mmetsp:Transcript_35568/g.100685  ORF Transcript_35568/g.100685 Transcript_35568/m.100685 type:complete len:497 (-) Transcript_35568:130-1620(-)|eukprot:CAMPEP_0117662010 /NCGR_PEP_ID=MMETSP0804-20121206/7834_1 /TAXON_ID=1074897 /ORGANISM="Tetraselmis astigmatica, Strain CCMP880" /LENGTH=496 /DNA_ID=CAMNT_0005468899 /DNA_START=312 /DNA_END=1802 /DNA_ORIENTATION=-
MAPNTAAEQQHTATQGGSTLGWAQEKAENVKREAEEAMHGGASDGAEEQQAKAEEAKGAIVEGVDTVREQVADLTCAAADLLHPKKGSTVRLNEQGVFQRAGTAADGAVSSAASVAKSAGGAALSVMGLDNNLQGADNLQGAEKGESMTLAESIEGVTEDASKNVADAKGAVDDSLETAKASLAGRDSKHPADKIKEDLKESFKHGKAMVAEAMGEATDGAEEQAEQAKGALVNGVNTVREQAAELIYATADLVRPKESQASVRQEKGLFQRVGTAADGAVSSAAGVAMSAGGTALSVIGLDSANQGESTLGEKIDSFGEDVSQNVGGAKQAVGENVEAAKANLAAAGEEAGEKAGSVHDAMWEGFDSGKAMAGDTLSDGAGTLRSDAEDVVRHGREEAAKQNNSLMEEAGEMKDWGVGNVKAVEEKLTDAGQVGKEEGESVWSSMVEGVDSAKDNVNRMMKGGHEAKKVVDEEVDSTTNFIEEGFDSAKGKEKVQ